MDSLQIWWKQKRKKQRALALPACFWFVLLLLSPLSIHAQDDDGCLDCHAEVGETMEKNGREVSIYVNPGRFMSSVHGEVGCLSCHDDVDEEEHPDGEKIKPASCVDCHDDAVAQFNRSLHGMALAKGKYLAPSCITCHGKHDIQPSSSEKSQTYVMNIPGLCGRCHKEGTPVSRLRGISEQHALEDYSQSIHGDGLFRRGLIVTAVCTSCHKSHDILPHENRASSINRSNIAATCLQCHSQIEKVHLKVIKGELWEKKPHQLPICIDCHQPHKVQRVFYEESFPDAKCMSCHSDSALIRTTDLGKETSLYVDINEHKGSAHGETQCVKCHANVSQSNNPVCQESGKVDCAMCHAEAVGDYEFSQHGTFHARGDSIAPYCTDCHGVHDVQKNTELHSPTFARNIPGLCGKCHREGQKAAVSYKGSEHEIIKNYNMSIHGKGLIESGLMVTATCIDCHTAHRELPAIDSSSSVNARNIASTCSQCHLGIYEEYKESIHSPSANGTEAPLPACNDCHLSHSIKRVDVDNFRQDILNQCGKCHLEVAETYFDTFHGKVSKLGSVGTARCYDCHGAHNILPISDSRSTLSRSNIVGTCKSCHPNSNRKFVGYLTHATHHNKTRYPFLYYTFWGMTTLLVCTFGFFGVHTLLWVPRAIYERRRNGKHQESLAAAIPAKQTAGKAHIQRFDPFSRFLHVLVIISFLSLAITGMTIKFAGVGVFQTLSEIMGGYAVTGFIHRFAAIITFLYFFLHLGHVVYKKRRARISLRELLFGKDSMLPRKRDLVEFRETIKWFLGMGPRPDYGRWTYWEKFDYFAVFWGVVVIGSSGMMLWFPEYFTNLGLPGWLINVATIIHSDEALLATGFIFTVHFFNTHFRPDKFPMDPVIFTGSVPLEELKSDRPREYEYLIKSRAIRKKVVEPPPRWFKITARIFGFTCLALGLFVIILVIYSMVFLYR